MIILLQLFVLFFISACGGSGSNTHFKILSDKARVNNVKIYKFAASTNADCTNMKTLFSIQEPTATTLGTEAVEVASGNLESGEYQCIAIEISDQLSFTANNGLGVCTDGATYSLDICLARFNQNPAEISTLIDGTEVDCGGTYPSGRLLFPEDNRIAMYLSTSGSDANTLRTPETAGLLDTPITVSDNSISVIMDLSGVVNDDDATLYCRMVPSLSATSEVRP